MFSSLRARLLLSYALISLLIIGVALLTLIIYLLRNPASDRREVQRLRLVASFVLQRNQLLNLTLQDVPSERLQEAARRVDQAIGARVVIFDPQNQLLVDSRQGVAGAPPEATFFRQRRLQTNSIYRDELGQQWLYHLEPMEGGFILMLSVPRPRVPLLAILREEILGPFSRGVLLALLLALLLAYAMARWIAEPLQRIARATEEFAQGKVVEIPLQGPQEVQALARSFNEMSAKVLASQRSQRDFIANISHDLKTPLTSIQGFAQAILDDTAHDLQGIKQAAQIIRNESERMYRLVLDLLELARLDSGVTTIRLEPFDLSALLRALQQKVQPLADRQGITLEFPALPADGSPDTMVDGDPDRLEQALANVLDNAVKYSPAGGKVEVGLSLGAGWIELSVADSGPGIPEADLERIFERFYQTDKARSGAGRGFGLGLAIAREIITLHGGEIRAYNRPAEGGSGGSVFIIRLPRARQVSTLRQAKKA